jgi:predicted RND superfamily exporter protein
MIVEIATATIVGITLIFALSLSYIPAMLQLSVRNQTGEVFRPSVPVAATAQWIGQHKTVVITALVVGTLVFAAYIPETEYVIGTVEVNLPQRDIATGASDKSHMLVMYERFQDKIKSTGQETVITIGSGPGALATRAALDDMIAIHRAMVADDFVKAAGGAVNSVPFILNLYAILKDGLQSAGPTVGQDILVGGSVVGTPKLDPAYDPTFKHIEGWGDRDIRQAYEDMLVREEWEPLLLTFMDSKFSIAWALTFVNIPIDQEATVRADAAFKSVLSKAAPKSTQNHYFGTLTGLKKYNDYTNYWLTMSSVVSLGIVCGLVALFTRRIRPVLAVATPMSLTFIWWLGALPTPVVDIQIAFVFLIPVAFITSLGSDYAVHLAWNLEKGANPRFVFKTVGKAVAYSGFTTAVSFFIFTRGAIRGSWEMFEACVLAIVLMTVLTFLTMPLFYFRSGRKYPDAPVLVPARRVAPAALGRPPRLNP